MTVCGNYFDYFHSAVTELWGTSHKERCFLSQEVDQVAEKVVELKGMRMQYPNNGFALSIAWSFSML